MVKDHTRNSMVSLLSKAATYFLAAYIVLLLGRALWTNYHLKQSIEKLQGQITTLEQQKKDLNYLITYYNSDSFKELEARKKLGLKRPDEKVAIVGVSDTANNFSETLQSDQEKISTPKTPSSTPNWVLWWQYFTK